MIYASCTDACPKCKLTDLSRIDCECMADWRQWFALFMAEGENIAMHGRES